MGYFTKWLEAYATHSQGATTEAVTLVRKFFCFRGVRGNCTATNNLRFTSPIGNLPDVHHPSAATIKGHAAKIREDRAAPKECHFNAHERLGQEATLLPAAV
jgi:hypothetical protein